MNLTNIIGKQVFALYEGEIIGTVCDVVFNRDLTKVSALKMFDQDENEYEIKFSMVKALNDCVIIANRDKLLTYFDKNNKSPMFKPAITEKATRLGKICDCDLTEKGAIKGFITDNNEILEPKYIYLRKNFVYYSKTKLLNRNIYPKKNVASLENIKVNILPFDNKNTDNFVPSKLQFNTDTILGKVAKDTLFGVNNEIIIKANQIISEKTIEDASRHNRLNQLYFIANWNTN